MDTSNRLRFPHRFARPVAILTLSGVLGTACGGGDSSPNASEGESQQEAAEGKDQTTTATATKGAFQYAPWPQPAIAAPNVALNPCGLHTRTQIEQVIGGPVEQSFSRSDGRVACRYDRGDGELISVSAANQAVTRADFQSRIDTDSTATISSLNEADGRVGDYAITGRTEPEKSVTTWVLLYAGDVEMGLSWSTQSSDLPRAEREYPARLQGLETLARNGIERLRTPEGRTDDTLDGEEFADETARVEPDIAAGLRQSNVYMSDIKVDGCDHSPPLANLTTLKCTFTGSGGALTGPARSTSMPVWLIVTKGIDDDIVGLTFSLEDPAIPTEGGD